MLLVFQAMPLTAISLAWVVGAEVPVDTAVPVEAAFVAATSSGDDGAAPGHVEPPVKAMALDAAAVPPTVTVTD